jgi:hypothetical protein
MKKSMAGVEIKQIQQKRMELGILEPSV